jgi:hypothetical protein
MDSTDTSGDEDEGSRARLVPYFSIALAKLFSLHFLNIYVVSFFLFQRECAKSKFST